MRLGCMARGVKRFWTVANHDARCVTFATPANRSAMPPTRTRHFEPPIDPALRGVTHRRPPRSQVDPNLIEVLIRGTARPTEISIPEQQDLSLGSDDE